LLVVAVGSAEVRIDKGGGVPPTALTVTVAVARTLLSEKLAAVTVTVVLLVTPGAVKRPLLEIVPALADQVTFTLLEFRIVAENCCVLLEETVALLGEMAMLAGCTVLAPCVDNPQDAVNPVNPKSKAVRMRSSVPAFAVANFRRTAQDVSAQLADILVLLETKFGRIVAVRKDTLSERLSNGIDTDWA
jgi:hypothetical protein